MGTLDANGVWRYDNNDNVTPLATFMNLLAISVSDALADLRADLTIPDSGWINLPLASGTVAVSGYTPRYRKIGSVVYIEGRCTNVTGSFSVGTLPAGFRPNNSIADLGNFAINDSAWRRVYCTSAGVLSVGACQGSTSAQANFSSCFVAS